MTRSALGYYFFVDIFTFHAPNLHHADDLHYVAKLFVASLECKFKSGHVSGNDDHESPA